jgi:NAD-dependent dihydropyrimidine dehydrogenase PreA subunit
MTFVITEPCIDVKDRSCVDVCPVDCIYTDVDWVIGLQVRLVLAKTLPKLLGPLARAALSLCDTKRRGTESNRRMEVLQTSALPLGYRAGGGKLLSRNTLCNGRRLTRVTLLDPPQ